MNILFITLFDIRSVEERGIYTDLLRKFRSEGHRVYVISPVERRFPIETKVIKEDRITIYKVRTLNIQKTSFFEKGISTLLIDFQFRAACKKHLNNVHFDLVLYTTPPITLIKVVNYIKKRDKALTYLLLKDIFPQNAVDLGAIKNGSFLHKYFRKKEKALYSVSDFIGCMSPANVEYILRNNTCLQRSKVEVNPNSIEPIELFLNEDEKQLIRIKYNLPKDKVLFIYGGNLGKPQGLDFLIEVMDYYRSQKKGEGKAFFLIVGYGTEFSRLKKWFDANQPLNARLFASLPKKEFDILLQSCDVGMIFLDKRFTIPNFPSRLLSYLEYKMPVLASTDSCTDIRNYIENNGFGCWSLTGDINSIVENINYLSESKIDLKQMGLKGYKLLLSEFTVSNTYQIIMKHS